MPKKAARVTRPKVEKIQFETMSLEEWTTKGKNLFGANYMLWEIVCPVCGHVARPVDWQKAGAPIGAVAYSCIGRWLPKKVRRLGEKGPGPCDYTGGGFFKFNPLTVEGHSIFKFNENKESTDA